MVAEGTKDDSKSLAQVCSDDVGEDSWREAVSMHDEHRQARRSCECRYAQARLDIIRCPEHSSWLLRGRSSRLFLPTIHGVVAAGPLFARIDGLTSLGERPHSPNTPHRVANTYALRIFAFCRGCLVP